MKALVTGGSGFIGSALVRHLLAVGYEVRVLARRKRNRLLDGVDVEISEGDIIYPQTVEKAMRGCGIVFNFASIYSFYPFWNKNPNSIYRINVSGTANVLTCALKYKVERLIHTSTIAAIGKNPAGRPSNEDAPFDFKRASHYARSKYLAEQEVLKFAHMGLPAVILNPAIAIGERDYKPTPSGETIVNFLNSRYPGYFDALWSVADVDDIARAHIAAIKNGEPGQRYILCNRRHYTLREIFKLLEEVSGVKAPKIYVPYPILNAFVHIDELMSYLLLKKKPLMPVEGVRFCRERVFYDNSRAVKTLGYKPTAIKDTFAKAVRWYRENGYVEPPGIMRLKTHGPKFVCTLMRRIGMDKYADKLNADTLFFYIAVRFLYFLRKIGFKPKGDGWRRVTQSYLRAEHAKFCLAVFRLDVWSDSPNHPDSSYSGVKQHIIGRLSRFFEQHPRCFWKIQYDQFCAQAIAGESVDITSADFDQSGNLINIEPYFYPLYMAQIDPESIRNLYKQIIRSYNETRSFRDNIRPNILRRRIHSWLKSSNNLDSRMFLIADRILNSTFISFERMAPLEQQRYQYPCFIKLKHPGFGFMNISCRFSHDMREADLWFQFSHIPDDGVPMQEVLNNLKRQWGICAVLQFPALSARDNPRYELCSTQNGDKGIYHIRDFIDFRPFLQERRELNRKNIGKNKITVTTAALFIWKLAHYPAFNDVKFSVPIDIRANTRRRRTLGFIFIRPGIYFDRHKSDGGFMKFQREFNRQLRLTRRRASESYKLLEGYALMPPIAYNATIKILPYSLREFVGTVGVTIIKRADLFIAPYSDVHSGGFIAVSNYFVPSEDGQKLCNISIKAPKKKIEEYLRTVKDIMGSQLPK